MHRRVALTASGVLSVILLGGTVAVAAVSGGGFLGFGHGASAQSGAGESVGAAAADPVQQVPSAPLTTPPSVVVEVIEDRIVIRSAAASPSAPPLGLRRVGEPTTPATIATPGTGPVVPRSWHDDDEDGDERHVDDEAEEYDDEDHFEDDDDHEDDD